VVLRGPRTRTSVSARCHPRVAVRHRAACPSLSSQIIAYQLAETAIQIAPSTLVRSPTCSTTGT
jgi:hypothetical protein